MVKLRLWIITLAGWTAGIIWNILTCILALTGFILEPFRGTLLHLAQRAWGYGIARLGCTRIDVTGLENIPRDRGVVFFANHTSAFDVYILSGIIPGRKTYFSKRILFYIPLVGLVMWLSGSIPVDRSNPRQALKAVAKATERVRRGLSLVIFPEGTRSRDGRLQPFKSGASRIPIHAGSLVVPVTISGAARIMHKGSMLLHRGPVTVHFSPPVSPPAPTASRQEIRDFLQVVHDVIEKKLTATS